MLSFEVAALLLQGDTLVVVVVAIAGCTAVEVGSTCLAAVVA